MQFIASLPFFFAVLASAAPAPSPVAEAAPQDTPVPTSPDYSGRCHYWSTKYQTDNTYDLWKGGPNSCVDFYSTPVEWCDKLLSGFCNVYPEKGCKGPVDFLSTKAVKKVAAKSYSCGYIGANAKRDAAPAPAPAAVSEP